MDSQRKRVRILELGCIQPKEPNFCKFCSPVMICGCVMH